MPLPDTMFQPARGQWDLNHQELAFLVEVAGLPRHRTSSSRESSAPVFSRADFEAALKKAARRLEKRSRSTSQAQPEAAAQAPSQG